MVLRACIPSIEFIIYLPVCVPVSKVLLIGGWSFFFVGKAEASLLYRYDSSRTAHGPSPFAYLGGTESHTGFRFAGLL